MHSHSNCPFYVGQKDHAHVSWTKCRCPYCICTPRQTLKYEAGNGQCCKYLSNNRQSREERRKWEGIHCSQTFTSTSGTELGASSHNTSHLYRILMFTDRAKRSRILLPEHSNLLKHLSYTYITLQYSYLSQMANGSRSGHLAKKKKKCIDCVHILKGFTRQQALTAVKVHLINFTTFLWQDR